MTGTVKEIIAELQKRRDQDEFLLLSVWTTEDVKGLDSEKEVSEDSAREVLVCVDDNFDANRGVNWETLSYYL